MKRRSFLKTVVYTAPSLYWASFPAMSASPSKVFRINLSTPGRFSFYIDYSELSSPGQHTFYVARTHGTQGDVSVDYSTNGDPHTVTSGTISFLDGESGVKSFVVNVPSKVVNGDHRMYVQLANPSGGAVLHNGDIHTIAYGVIDDGTIAEDTDSVFFDSSAVTNGSGTQVSPYNNIYDAISNVGSKRYIYGKGTVVPDGTNTTSRNGGGGIPKCINVPAGRSGESTRLYMQAWPGFNLAVDGAGSTDIVGFDAQTSGKDYLTYRNIDFTNLDCSALNNCEGGGIAYLDGIHIGINVEYCTGNNINGSTNTALYNPYDVDGSKMWRCASNNVQVNGVNTNQNTAGVLTFKGKNISVQRCNFSNSYKGLYHKKVGVAGDTTTSFRFNFCTTLEGASYSASGGGDVGHSHAIVQSNIFKRCTQGGVVHLPGFTSNTVVAKSLYVTNNIFDSCGVGEVGSIYTRHAYENIIFNNIFFDCRKTWADFEDTTAIKTPTMEYADYNNDFGTTLASQRYELAQVKYATSSSLPSILGDNDTQFDPNFLNTDENIYLLDTNSNCIANGVDGTDQGAYLLKIEVIGVNGLVKPSKITDVNLI
jgi:hypothetical protein